MFGTRLWLGLVVRGIALAAAGGMVWAQGLHLVTVAPCRLADTRSGPIIAAGSARDFAVPRLGCNIPATAQAYSLNVTAVPAASLGYLTIWPTGQPRPNASTLNSWQGLVVANAAIVPAGTNGSVSVFVSNDSHVILDINGYFDSSSGPASYSFYPATPCRVADTRTAGGPLAAGQRRDVDVPASPCGIPETAAAYSLNFTVVPSGYLGYLSTWPAGQPQPNVSTLNSWTGKVVANAAIVAAGTNGSVSVLASNPTDAILDINGYFAAPGSLGALTFYPVTPCRVADTRWPAETFGGPKMAGQTTRSFPIPASACNIPPTAAAYSLNVTVVPDSYLGYLSVWPAGGDKPNVSTLNSWDGTVVANAATVPAGENGAIDVFVTNPTHVILDINGYFQAPVSFVAANGSDSNPGTAGQPYLTIQKCATTVASGSVCAVRAGTYRETVTPSSGVTIEAYGAEQVTVDGSDPVTQWSLHNGSIYKTSVTLATDDTNQVFVNGEMMTEARWPNGNDLFNVNWATAQAGTTASQIVDSNLPSIDWTGAKVHLFSGDDPWANQTGAVTASQPGQVSITLDAECFNTAICPATGGSYYLFGILGALDAEREWAYNSGANTLYLWAPGGVNPNTLDVRAKRRPWAFDLSSRSGVTIRDINLFASSIRMDGSSSNNTIDGINARYVSHFTRLPDFSSSAPSTGDLAHIQDTGIIVQGSGNVVENSTIAYSSGNGVTVLGPGSTVRNNLIHHTDYGGSHAAGIFLWYGNNIIRNNTVHTTGRGAVEGCFWFACDHNQISYNNLFNGMILSVDGGEFYIPGASVSGTTIDHNWMHDTQTRPPASACPTGPCPATGVYLDSAANGFEVAQNVLWNNARFSIFVGVYGSVTPNNNNVHNNTVPDLSSNASIELASVSNCGTTRVVDNLVLVPVDESWTTPLCPAIDNGPTAPGATEMTASVQVGCNFAGCASEAPPAIVGGLVGASIAIQPADVTVSAGRAATFTVTAAGSPPLNYQWQRNGVNISGATGAGYTTAATTMADSGAVFTVVVGNSVGQVVSDGATLTVE